MVNFKLHLYFSRWAGVVVIKLKANLSSTGTGLANCNGAWQQTDIVISKGAVALCHFGYETFAGRLIS